MTIDKIDNPNLKIWRCICCQATLGFVERKEVVRIKRQDVYIQVSGGNISMNCYRCGKINFLNDDKNDVVDLQEKK
jgi:hypothetical protein